MTGTYARAGRWARALAVVPPSLVVVLLLVACEAPGVPHPLAASAPSTSDGGTTSAVVAPTAEPVPDGGDGGLVLEGIVGIELTDFKITPNEFTVKAGEVTFAFENKGRYTHDFRIEGQGIDVKAPKIGARRSREWSATLAPGTYRISCPISNHDQRGMEGTLVVVD